MVIPHESYQSLGRKLETGLVGRGTPDSSSHGNQVIVTERLRIALTVQILSNGQARSLLLLLSGRAQSSSGVWIVCDQVQRELIKADDVEN